MLSETVTIARRFQRAIRIDADASDVDALKGFICPKSSADTLIGTAKSVAEVGQGAFTWTGPFGSGKSSLAVAFSALMGGEKALQKQAISAFGPEVARELHSLLPPKRKGWLTIPVVGRRAAPREVIAEALLCHGIKFSKSLASVSDADLVDILASRAQDNPDEGGVLLVIDEMGKFLEAVASDGEDVYLFQLLAEAASRSEGRFIVIGILHQAFEEYAGRLSREARDEWTKIQGRFSDFAVNAAGEEQVELIARAIENENQAEQPGRLATAIAGEIGKHKPSLGEGFSNTLEACMPLHPVVACLLGPISRRRFGQNQRSIFAFLNSAESYAFQDFLKHAPDTAMYQPFSLWDYLRANLEPTILSSPDGHRWAMASEAIERCEGLGGTDIHLRLLKTIALIDLFKERSGLLPTKKILENCLTGLSKRKIADALEQLQSWSLVVFRRFNSAFVIYAGSDFDIEDAIRSAAQQIESVDFGVLQRLAGLQPILAKRHYHETGALRWMDFSLIPADQVGSASGQKDNRAGVFGDFLLAIPTAGENQEDLAKSCAEVSVNSGNAVVVAGFTPPSVPIVQLAKELAALELVQLDHPDLAGDQVAQREIAARHGMLEGQLQLELRRAISAATWLLPTGGQKRLSDLQINALTSEFAGSLFSACPRIQSEMLNRTRPSANAVAAQNILLRRMVGNSNEARLGIEGYPAEGGLYASVLEATGLHVRRKTGFGFAIPNPKNDPFCLSPLWEAASDFLRENADRTISVGEIYQIWRAPPYGVKPGLMPVLAVAFILSRGEHVSVYRDGVFQARFKDVDVEILAKDPDDIQVRWLDLGELSRDLLSSMAEIVRDLDEQNQLENLTPIDVARGLIAVFDKMHPWTKRTLQLSGNAAKVRDLFKHANDPNKFLFDDIPALFSGAELATSINTLSVASALRDGLTELSSAYETMMGRFSELMLSELKVPNNSAQSLVELTARAELVQSVGGDFRLDAFSGRLRQYDGSLVSLEGIASLAANKPTRDWTDRDLERARLEIAKLSQEFVRNEAYVFVKGRQPKRHAISVIVGTSENGSPIAQDFSISDGDKLRVQEVASKLQETLKDLHDVDREIVLAALAQLAEQRIRENKTERELA